ncbi:hypothetical protein BHE74_00032487 [Ensete ventricosum]|nr:hypothetical protein BHE74_00032487 [Ensete ventricosum]RZR96582.1 hypothetical protein BHM03_00025635 [Ensete ventricosum]
MKAAIPSLIAPSSLCLDRIGGLEEPFVSDLEENLYPSCVEWDRERPERGLWLAWRSCSLTESEEMASGSEGTRTTFLVWLAGYITEVFGFSTVTSVRRRSGPPSSGCSPRVRRLPRGVLVLVHQHLRQLGDIGDDGLHHPGQCLDLLGEAKERFGRNNRGPGIRCRRSESWVIK